ncbi:MAG: fused MFS/spermidine synthase [Pseudomonadota bacterium]
MSDQSLAGAPAGMGGLAGRLGASPYVATVFLSASLVFLVQPMFAKMATPLLGGSPSVWNVSLVCFQAALLLGYAYAHALVRFVAETRAQVAVHAAALALGALVLPLGLTGALGDPDPSRPTLWLIGVFALSIAPPFAVISATAPLIQAWYARSGRPDAADPYHLYGASNIGSLLGLAAYPLVLEPLAPLAGQSFAWTLGYGLLALMLLGSGALAAFGNGGQAAAPAAPKASATAGAWTERLRWMALAFIPSSLLVGATTHISTDVASAPFLWAPPLMVFLTTFIIVFAKRPPISLAMSSRFLPLAVGAALLALPPLTQFPLVLDFAIHLVALFLAALVCHGALAESRPEAGRLTEFYLLMSLGGVLGGAFNALLAPVLFNSILEYPLLLAAALLARPAPRWGWAGSERVWVSVALAALAGAIGLRVLAGAGDDMVFAFRLILALAVVAILFTKDSRIAPALGALAAWGVGAAANPTSGGEAERGFFGVVKLIERDGYRVMMHGTTIHGAQALEGEQVLRPTTYYAPEAAIGQVFEAVKEPGEIGVVGLGAGSVACYRQTGQRHTYYEIDPIVARAAADPALFTYLSECAPDAEIVLGDGRLTLADAPQGVYRLLLIDAFSSDSIPAHLLTREAFELYLSRLTDDGVLAVHVSNRHMALAPVVARIAGELGAPAMYQFYQMDAGADRFYAQSSEVVILAKSEAALQRFAGDPRWAAFESDGGRPWTDDYSNLIGAILEKRRD